MGNFKQCNRFRASRVFKRRTLVSAIGRQPGSDVWVLEPEIQINSKGELLDKEDLPFYWYSGYTLKKNKDIQRLTPLPIALPLQAQVSKVYIANLTSSFDIKAFFEKTYCL